MGEHPYTCTNCAIQIPILRNVMTKRGKGKCKEFGSRIGTRGFRTDYGNIDEKLQYLDSVVTENKLFCNDLYSLKKCVLNKITWENKLTQSLHFFQACS